MYFQKYFKVSNLAATIIDKVIVWLKYLASLITILDSFIPESPVSSTNRFISYRISGGSSETGHTDLSSVSLLTAKPFFTSDAFFSLGTQRPFGSQISGDTIGSTQAVQSRQARLALHTFTIASGPAFTTFARPILLKRESGKSYCSVL